MVTVSSSIAARGKIGFEDLPADRRYQWFASYARSKLANLMFALELDHRAKDGKAGLASHPGAASSSLLTGKERDWGRRPRLSEVILACIQALAGQPPRRRPDAALRGDRGRPYRRRVHRPRRTGPPEGAPQEIAIPEAALAPAVRRRLWDLSAPAHRSGLCGAHLTLPLVRPTAGPLRRGQGRPQVARLAASAPGQPLLLPAGLVPGSRGPITLVR